MKLSRTHRRSIIKDEDTAIYRGVLVSCRDTDKKVRVRIPSLYGGTNDPNRVPDSRLLWYPSLYRFSPSDVGKLVYVAYVGGNRTSPIVLGVATEQDSHADIIENLSSVIELTLLDNSKILINKLYIITVASNSSGSTVTYKLSDSQSQSVNVQETVSEISSLIK